MAKAFNSAQPAVRKMPVVKDFKVALMCSQRHGILGRLPTGMDHQFRNEDGHQQVGQISVR